MPRFRFEEIVEPGVTGAIVDSVDEAVRTLPHVLALDRRRVRHRFEQRFTATRMAKDYLAVYRSLLERAVPAEQVAELSPLQPALEAGMN